MIRETCGCGAEFETDLPEQVELVKQWRKTHKHSNRASEAPTGSNSVLSNTDIALGFQAIYDPLDDDND